MNSIFLKFEIPNRTDTIDLTFKKKESIVKIKRHLRSIFQRNGIDNEIDLFYQNQDLTDNTTLNKYDIPNNSIIKVKVTDRSAKDKCILNVKNQHNNIDEWISVPKNSTFEDVKEAIVGVVDLNNLFRIEEIPNIAVDKDRIFNVGTESVLTVVENGRKGRISMTNITFSSESIIMDFDSSETVATFKNRVASKIKHVKDFILIHKNVYMDERKKMIIYDLEARGSLIRYVPVERFTANEEASLIDMQNTEGIFDFTFDKRQVATMYRYDSIGELKAMVNEIVAFHRLGTHDHIVKFLGLYKLSKSSGESVFFVATEYLQMGNLEEFMKMHGPLTETKTFNYISQLLLALKEMHQGANIIHRKIKCSSIYLVDLQTIKISNFKGLKYLVGARSSEMDAGVVPSVIDTEFNWTAPEVIDDMPYGAKADIWSVGAVMIEMITGKKPFGDMQMHTVVVTINREKKITYDKTKYSQKMNYIISLCLNPIPEQRKNASDLLDEIKNYSENPHQENE